MEAWMFAGRVGLREFSRYFRIIGGQFANRGQLDHRVLMKLAVRCAESRHLEHVERFAARYPNREMRLDQLEEQLRHVRKNLAQIEIDPNPQSIEAAGRDSQLLVLFGLKDGPH